MSVFTSESVANFDEPSIADLGIAGIDEPVILHYFTALNAGEFERVSQLFAIDGVLKPPFEDMVVGPAAIAAYLDKEARGFRLEPRSGTATELENGCTEFEILGTVQTPWFGVNVAWTFILSPARAIFLVKVKLLASLKELLPLRDVAKTAG